MARRSITRRDFRNGARIGLTGVALSPWLERFGRAPIAAGAPAPTRSFGPIAIASSDARASAYTGTAIDPAHRAAGELLTPERKEQREGGGDA